MREQSAQPLGLTGRGGGKTQISRHEQLALRNRGQKFGGQIPVQRNQAVPWRALIAKPAIGQRGQNIRARSLQRMRIRQGRRQMPLRFNRHILVGWQIGA